MGKKIKVPGAKRPFSVRDKGARREDDERRSGMDIREIPSRQVPGRRNRDERREDEDRRK